MSLNGITHDLISAIGHKHKSKNAQNSNLSSKEKEGGSVVVLLGQFPNILKCREAKVQSTILFPLYAVLVSIFCSIDRSI